jgi:hypothetical protein
MNILSEDRAFSKHFLRNETAALKNITDANGELWRHARDDDATHQF